MFQSSKKLNCPAVLVAKEVAVFSLYKVTCPIYEGLSFGYVNALKLKLYHIY